MVLNNHVDDSQLDFDEADRASIAARLLATFGIADNV